MASAAGFTGTTLAKTGKKLDELAGRLARGKTRRSRDKVEAEIASIISATWVRRVVRWELTGGEPKDFRLAWDIDEQARDALEEEIFGKHVLITSHDDWPVPEVVAGYRAQSEAEFSFRQMKNPHVVSFSPMHHWTEHSIRVHVFTCVLALQLAHLMRLRARRAGLDLSVRDLLGQLAAIGETVLVYPSTGGRPKARRMTTELVSDQPALHDIFGLQRWAPAALGRTRKQAPRITGQPKRLARVRSLETPARPCPQPGVKRLGVVPRFGTMNGMDGLAGFFERGWVRLAGAFDPSGLAEALWRELSAHGPRPGDPVTWRQAGSQSLAGKWLTKFGQSGVFAAVGSDAVGAALDELLGDGWTGQAGGWGRPLVTFPVDGDWEIPASGWHLDSPPAPRLPTVRMFAYLSEVPGQGGGTLVVEGSHRLAAAYPGAHSRTVRDQLSQQDPWLSEIWHPAGREDRIAALMDHGAEIGGVRLRVAELTGAPGDVVLWHPALFHAAAPNTARHPRFMLTHTALHRAR